MKKSARQLEREEFLADVKAMRQVRAREWKGIVLDEPSDKPTRAAQKREPSETPAERAHRIMFAHSSVRPPFEPPPEKPSDRPRAVVARRQGAEGHDDGEVRTAREGETAH